MVRNLPANAGDLRDLRLIPGSGRSLGGGHSNPLQYSCLEKSHRQGAWWAAVQGGHKEPDMTEKLTMVYVNTDSITASCFYFSRSGQHLFNKGLHLRATGLTQAHSQWADVGTKQAGCTHAITPLKDE